ncbi:DUF2309 domain-containing protein, partial [Oscillochloris sp. ZM17-4]|uniref:DUF2309 domain-containing protein n=1 Tax=Oscillochloris sp. ZM17-4 TaxID=2866714 RepID=UPI001C72A921
LWGLDGFVAVNPFLGFVDWPLAEAARAIGDGIGARVLPDMAFYRERWRGGAFVMADLVHAARRAGQEPPALAAILSGAAPTPLRPSAPALTFAERHDHAHGTRWEEQAVRHVALWCAALVPPDGSAPAGLYAAWRDAARADRSLEIAGLRGWRAWARGLPAQPAAALATALDALQVAPAERPSYLYHLLGGVLGWASYLRRDTWAAGDHELGPLLDLLAIRACTDAAIAQGTGLGIPTPNPQLPTPNSQLPTPGIEDEDLRLIFQEALEDSYVRGLLGDIRPPAAAPQGRPDVQAVFCIDVRSEPLRRHLEAQSPAVETLGFAGFFGVALDWRADGRGSARCPALLAPGVRVASREAAPAWQLGTALKKLSAAPAAAFTYVETLGLGYALGLAGDALGRLSARRADEGSAPLDLGAIAPEARIDLAAGILKNMGLRERYGRLVMLCGHAGHSENNPHQSGLDCGACGGHGGAINARVAAALLNDPAVRAALPGRGFPVPTDTHFLPALHSTTTDNVRLLDVDLAPAGHRGDMARLEGWLAEAGARTRAERSAGLGIAPGPQGLIDRLIGRRARDWSEPRPEWALARNAAFIAARRGRTRGVDLGGRAFLHEYDWTTDPDSSILTLILTAPMVVASWINLQYFASTVDNERFGCGTKALHNRVGALGVVLGNGGDLRPGLALQSVRAADGGSYHEPLRLQVVVEAPQERIAAVLAAQPAVRALVENGWLRLFALDPAGGGAARYLPGGGWV